MPPDPPSFSMLRMLGVLCTPAPSKGPLFLEKNLPTLSSAYGPGITSLLTIPTEIESKLMTGDKQTLW